jgi:DNA-binding NarL/FixJ family response regulator
MQSATFEVRTRGPEGADTPDEPLTVVLAHDRSPTGRDIREALEDDGFVVSAEAGSASQVVEEVVNREPQICLLDVDLPGGSTQAIEEIVAERPGTRIGVIADSTSRQRVIRAIRAGADGVVLTRTPPEEVPAAVRALLHGEQPLPRALRRSIEDELQELARSNSRDPRSLGATLLYVPRFARHLVRRLRSRMPLEAAWASALQRMQTYR